MRTFKFVEPADTSRFVTTLTPQSAADRKTRVGNMTARKALRRLPPSSLEGSQSLSVQNKKGPRRRGPFLFWTGGERGIRTLEGLLTLTPLAGVRLRPLGHLSGATIVGTWS